MHDEVANAPFMDFMKQQAKVYITCVRFFYL